MRYHGPEEPESTKFPPGFVIVPKIVVDAMPKIRAAGVAVYVALKKHADNETDKSFPSIRTLAEDTGLHTDTVLAALDRLVEERLIDRKKSKRPRGWNQYQM
jgi:predicted transcriptional regulator